MPELTIEDLAVVQPKCFGENGTLDVTSTGGTEPHYYSVQVSEKKNTNNIN